MKFIDRLIPFFSEDAFSKNMLTAFWIIALILICIAALIYLYYQSSKIKKDIKNFKDEEIRTNNKFLRLWNAYKGTFNSFGNSKEKTIEYSEVFFNEQNILYLGLNFRVINNVSNILVGLGILGTFVGLTYGIADSSFETTAEIKSSINNLLSGMGTAFVTSIWGMGLSLLFTTLFKVWQSNTTRHIQQFCLSLDEDNKIKQAELDSYQNEKQRKNINDLFNEYLVADTDEGKQLPKNVFRQLLEESEKQTNSLQSFADDLGSSIELALEKLVEDNSLQFSQLIEEKLVPVLEELKQIKQDSGTQVIENSVKQLSETMKYLMNDFKDSVMNDTKQEMDDLIVRLTVVSESLTSIPDTMSGITQQIGETIDALKNTVIENINQSRTEAQNITLQNREAFSTATNKYKATVEDLQANMEMLLSTQKDNIKQVSDLTREINSTLIENSKVNHQFETIVQKSKSVAQLIENVSIKFENNSESLSDTSKSLKTSVSDFGISINEYINRNNELLNNQKETLIKTKNVTEEYGNRFDIIEKGLSGIFDQIQTGLKDYQTTTADNLNKYLTEFSTTLSKAHDGLEGSISGLTDINEELTEQVEKLVSIR